MADDDEAIIYCWPYTAAAEGDKSAKVARLTNAEKILRHKYEGADQSGGLHNDPVTNIVIGFLFVWVLLICYGMHINLGGSIWMVVKALPFVALPLLAMRRGLTHIRVNKKGIILESSAGKQVLRKTELKWNQIDSVYVKEPPPGRSLLASKLVIKTWPEGKLKQISMKKIATAGEWRKLVASLQHFSARSSLVISLDNAYLDGLSNAQLDAPSYTKLWLEALIAPPKRERLLPLKPGTELKAGRFKIERKLGTGGQGSAYLARTEGGDQVVLKEYILPVYVEKSVRKQAIESFYHEATTLASLSNNHIVKLVDSFIEDQRAYLILEYVRGLSLRQLVQTKGTVSEWECLGWAVQMCEALHYLHSQVPPVVHQDFTPDNVILDDTGTIKVIDFMVAKQLVDDSATSTVVGKHHYMPPEQFRGKATTQSDIYALGCTLYFILTSLDPEPMSPAHPILLNAEVSGELDALVERTTQIDCAKRYKNVSEVRRDLELILGQKGVRRESSRLI